jgi:uncharacterized membrane protein
MAEQNPSTANQAGLSDNAAGGLAYVTIIPAILFLILAPYNRNPTVRFHSWQCLFLAIAWLVIHGGLIVVGMVPGMGWPVFVLEPLVGLGFFVVWIYVLINTFNGKRIKLPIVGDLAEKQANG